MVTAPLILLRWARHWSGSTVIGGTRQAGILLLAKWLGTHERMGFTSCKDVLKSYFLYILILLEKAGRSPWRAEGFSWSLENLHGDLKKEIPIMQFLKREKILSLHLFFHQKPGSGFNKYRSESLLLYLFLKGKMFLLPSLKLWLVNTT